MSKKLTYEYVKNYFTEQNCELLETEYINSKTKMKYKCKCGNNSNIDWSHFKQGNRCMKCGGSEKLTLEYVKKFFKEQRCKLLETEYINAHSKMKYICKCGNDSSTSFDSFKQGHRCSQCYGNEKLTYEYVKNYFTEQGCELIETEYINSYTKMKYKCKDDHITSISWSNFKKGYRCISCSSTEKLTLDFVKEEFKKAGCELLETEYTNNNTLMKYKCKCGNISEIRYSNFQKGRRCMTCGFDKHEKSSKSFKQFKFPSGEIRNIQGYENLALDELVKIFKEDDIITKRSEMPKIIYKLKGKEHRYYPDIWIKSINKIIEVKSCYIYNKELIKNINKALATRKLNFEFEFWIYTPEKKNIYSKIII
jgi:phage terminase small subunit